MRSRVLVRVLLSVLAGGMCGVVVTCAVVLLGGDDPEPTTAPPVASGDRGRPRPVEVVPAREVLRDWDAARADAWVDGAPDALAALYTPRSVAGRRDVAMLRAWSRRGARVSALSTQVLGLDVVVERERRLVLDVVDRVARLESGGTTLSGDRASERRITLVRERGAWLVASVSALPRARSG